MEVATPGFEPPPQLPGPCDHYTNRGVKLIVLEYFSLPFTLFEPCGAVFMMNSKIHLRKNSSKEYFIAILHYFCVRFTLNNRSMNALIFFFVALAEVQIAILSVLNLPWQGFLATCRIGHCCVCSPLLFASQILCNSPGNSPTYSK